MTDRPTNAYAVLAQQGEVKAEGQRDDNERLAQARVRHERWFRRLEAWGLRQSTRELAGQFALARIEVFIERRLAKLRNEVKQLALEKHDHMKHQVDFLDRQVAELAAEAHRSRAARKLGGKKRAEGAGFPAKRTEVLLAWAAYTKRGRGAKTRFTTDQAALHGVSPRTIEKWIGGK